MVDHFIVSSSKRQLNRVLTKVSYLQVGVDYPLTVEISINPDVMTRDEIIETIVGWYNRAGIDTIGAAFKRASIHLKGCITKIINENKS